MANWRRKALALFPDLRPELEQRSSTVYLLFMDLLPRLWVAHKTGDQAELRRIYGFAEWCSRQKATDLWNSAGVSFYEHLFDSHPSYRSEVVRWLSPTVIRTHWGLWEQRLTTCELKELRRLIDDCPAPCWREANLAQIAPPPGVLDPGIVKNLNRSPGE